MFLHRMYHARLKRRIFFEISRAGAIVAENEREDKEEDVGIAPFLWFEQKLGQGAHLSKPLLKQKACDLACSYHREQNTPAHFVVHKINVHVYYKGKRKVCYFFKNQKRVLHVQL